MKTSFQDKLKAAAQEKEDSEQEWNIRNENLRGKMDAIEEKLKSKSSRVVSYFSLCGLLLQKRFDICLCRVQHELEAESQQMEEKLRVEKEQNESLRSQLAALKFKSKISTSSIKASAARGDYVDDGSEKGLPAPVELGDGAPERVDVRRQSNGGESLASTIEDLEEMSVYSVDSKVVKAAQTPSVVEHISDDDVEEEQSVASASVASARKKKKKTTSPAVVKPTSRGSGISKQASKLETPQERVPSRQSEVSTVSDVDEEQTVAAAAEDHESATVPSASSKVVAKKPKSRKTVTKPSTPSGGRPTSSHEDPNGKPPKTPKASTKKTKLSQELSGTKSGFSEVTGESETSAKKKSGPIDRPGSVSVTDEVASDHSDLSDDEKPFGSESEEDTEVLITPFSEERMKKLLVELKAEPSNLNSALRFCAVLERSTRMALQDSLNNEKNPNVAHEQVSLASLKLAKELFTQVRKYSIENLERATKEYQQQKPSFENIIITPEVRPSTEGDKPLIAGPPFDKFDQPLAAEKPFSFDLPADVADYIVMPERKNNLEDENDALVKQLREEVDNLQKQLKGIRQASSTDRQKDLKPAKKKASAIIIRNRRSSDAVVGTGKLFRTFYRAKSTVSVEEGQDENFDEREEDYVLKAEEKEAQRLLEAGNRHDDGDQDADVLVYEIVDEVLEDVVFSRGITVGANEMIMDQSDLGSASEKNNAKRFSIIMDGRFGQEDLVMLTMIEREIMSLEYFIAKRLQFERENPNAAFAEKEINRAAKGV